MLAIDVAILVPLPCHLFYGSLHEPDDPSTFPLLPLPLGQDSHHASLFLSNILVAAIR
jgi:hypothetical protein